MAEKAAEPLARSGADRDLPSIPPVAIRGLAVICLSAVIVWAIWGHHFDLNGTRYHRWIWRNVTGLWPHLMVLGLGAPFFVAQWIYLRQPRRVAASLALMMLSSLALMVAFAVEQSHPPSLGGIARVVLSPVHSGYFSQADRLRDKDITIRQWLEQYPRLLPTFSLHPRVKPPGPLLFSCDVIAVAGSSPTAAILDGLLIGFLATFSIPAVYAFVGKFTGRQGAAFAAASYFALCPGFLLMFPQFDQCYPILTAGLTVVWATALANNTLRPAVRFGFLLALTFFITYLPAVLVIFLGGYTLLRWPEHWLKWRFVALRCLCALDGFMAFYLVLWLATRFDPVATFRTCLRDQRQSLALFVRLGYVPRLWPGTIPGDIYDFALGSGWIAYPIAAFFLLSAIFAGGARPMLKITLLCLSQFVLVALLGLVQCETARVWIFMLPMLMLPVGLELASWNFKWRMTVFAALLVLTVTAWHSMTFFR